MLKLRKYQLSVGDNINGTAESVVRYVRCNEIDSKLLSKFVVHVG